MKNMSVSMKLLLILLGGGLFFGIHPAKSMDVNINISGEIYIPPCKVNEDTEIQVHFGKISLYTIDGQQNAQTKTVTVSCDYYQGTPYVRIDGALLQGAGDNVLHTAGVNSSKLGIALYQGKDVNIAYPLRIGGGALGKYGYKITRGVTGQNTASGTFSFTAVPVNNSSDKLIAGEFSATATMNISYL